MKNRLLRVDAGVFLFGVRFVVNPLWAAVFVGRFGFVVIGKEGGKPNAT